jgi:outer membrane immunogenic protein
MMKQVSLGFAGLLALTLTAPAFAADLPARGYNKAAPVAVSPYYDWSGFYIGANAGYGWARDDHADLLGGGGFFTFGPGGIFGGRQRVEPRGAVYGGQMGYNWQAANWVYGLEVAGDGSNLKRTDLALFGPGEFLTSKVDGFVTVTGRLGYALNNWLPYIKGGYAGAALSTRNFDILGNSLNHRDWRSGYVVGAGLEYGITPDWTVGVEYNYMDFGTGTWTDTSFGPGAPLLPPPGQEFYSDRLKISTVTGRVNYKFSGPGVARY